MLDNAIFDVISHCGLIFLEKKKTDNFVLQTVLICVFINWTFPGNSIVTRVEEEHLWESRQLGVHSPYVLLSTLLYLNTKHFQLAVSKTIIII